MSKAQAREILELEVGVTDTAMIKTAYKIDSVDNSNSTGDVMV